jgi:hypothetical protein
MDQLLLVAQPPIVEVEQLALGSPYEKIYLAWVEARAPQSKGRQLKLLRLNNYVVEIGTERGDSQGAIV